jgi:hypothetical protein
MLEQAGLLGLLPPLSQLWTLPDPLLALPGFVSVPELPLSVPLLFEPVLVPVPVPVVDDPLPLPFPVPFALADAPALAEVEALAPLPLPLPAAEATPPADRTRHAVTITTPNLCITTLPLSIVQMHFGSKE